MNPGNRDAKESRRAIDLYTVARIEEQLRIITSKAEDAYEAIYGGKGTVGLAEQMRTMLKVWGVIVTLVSGVLGSWTWIYDKLSNTSLFGDELLEKWRKQSTRRMRVFNKEKGVWEYWYAIEERKVPMVDRGGSAPP